MAKKKGTKRTPRDEPDVPNITVVATPRRMSALPPRQRTRSADVQGGESSRTARKVTGRRRNIDGIAQRGRTRAPTRRS